MKTNQIYHRDCVKGMVNIPPASVDLVLTDPPFGTDFQGRRSNYARNASKVIRGAPDIPSEQYYEFTLKWMRGVDRVLKPSGAMFVFSGWNNLRDVLNALHALGFETINHVIWEYQFGVYTTRRFVTSHYHLLYVAKEGCRNRKFFPHALFRERWVDSERVCNVRDPVRPSERSASYKDRQDVWHIKREYWMGKVRTPNKLPEEIVHKILALTSEKGDLVLDPFMGSGQVPLVCKRMKRRFIGFEINQQVYVFAGKRIFGTRRKKR